MSSARGSVCVRVRVGLFFVVFFLLRSSVVVSVGAGGFRFGGS